MPFLPVLPHLFRLALVMATSAGNGRGPAQWLLLLGEHCWQRLEPLLLGGWATARCAAATPAATPSDYAAAAQLEHLADVLELASHLHSDASAPALVVQVAVAAEFLAEAALLLAGLEGARVEGLPLPGVPLAEVQQGRPERGLAQVGGAPQCERGVVLQGDAALVAAPARRQGEAGAGRSSVGCHRRSSGRRVHGVGWQRHVGSGRHPRELQTGHN